MDDPCSGLAGAEAKALGDRQTRDPGDLPVDDEKRQAIALTPRDTPVDQEILQAPPVAPAQRCHPIAGPTASNLESSALAFGTGRRSDRQTGAIRPSAEHPGNDPASPESESDSQLVDLHLPGSFHSIREFAAR